MKTSKLYGLLFKTYPPYPTYRMKTPPHPRPPRRKGLPRASLVHMRATGDAAIARVVVPPATHPATHQAPHPHPPPGPPPPQAPSPGPRAHAPAAPSPQPPQDYQAGVYGGVPGAAAPGEEG